MIQIILSSHLFLCIPRGLFLSGFPTKTLYKLIRLHACYMPLPSHSSPFLISGNMSGENYISFNSSQFSFLHCNVTTSLLDPNILLNTLLSHTLILRPSLNGSNEFSQIDERKEAITILCILTFIYLERMLEETRP